MDINELIQELVKAFDADPGEEDIIATVVLEAFDLGYATGLEDAEIMHFD